MKGFIFLAHGSPRLQWRAPLDALVEAVTVDFESGTGVLAFMGHCKPSLEGAVSAMVASGRTEVLVFPLFVSGGGHVSVEVAAQMDKARHRFPQVTLRVLPALGELGPVIAALRDVVREALD